jgi:hypothetical protein
MRKEITSTIMIVSACVLLLFVSGIEGCDGGTDASKTGLDFSATTGIDYISAGKTLNLGDSFYVGVKIENYDKQPRTGYVCIRDDVADSFGGIKSEECKPFNVKSAETTGGKNSKTEPGTMEIDFPSAGEYSYNDIP